MRQQECGDEIRANNRHGTREFIRRESAVHHSPRLAGGHFVTLTGKESRSMPRDLILGTAGHIDHGKTALVKALTGIDCDRLPEEKKRGITIDIGFARLDLGDYQLGVVDVPGHERFIKNMLAGATSIDLAMLVVSAGESIKPQTREHLE